MDASVLGHYWPDFLFVALLIIFIFTAHGLLSTLLEVLTFIISLAFSYQFHSLFAAPFVYFFKTPHGIADAVGFFMCWLVVESLLYFILFYLMHRYFLHIHTNPWNQRMAFLAGIVQGGIIFLFLITLIFALPVRGNIKKDILNSQTGPLFVNLSQSFQLGTKKVFGGAVTEALNFLTIKPKSGETVILEFKVPASQTTVDEDSEQAMLKLVNEERTKVGLSPLVPDESLRELGRSYGKEMFEGGFFSHLSKIDGSSPGDRANKKNIQYQVLGENLAFAPDVYIAHQGLMNSEGHRANILGTDYHKVGIGVIDGGVYGKMFVQEFSD